MVDYIYNNYLIDVVSKPDKDGKHFDTSLHIAELN